MTIKVYISGICGSQEVRKRQQRVLFILQSMPIDLQVIDVTEPGREEDRIFMQEECKKHDKKDPLPPQIFNENEYCGDYGDFQLANDDDVVLRFLKLESATESVSNEQVAKDSAITNGLADHEEIKNEILENHEVPQDGSKDATESVTNAVPDEADTQQTATNEVPQEEQGKKESSEEEESEEEEESD